MSCTRRSYQEPARTHAVSGKGQGGPCTSTDCLAGSSLLKQCMADSPALHRRLQPRALWRKRVLRCSRQRHLTAAACEMLHLTEGAPAWGQSVRSTSLAIAVLCCAVPMARKAQEGRNQEACLGRHCMVSRLCRGRPARTGSQACLYRDGACPGRRCRYLRQAGDCTASTSDQCGVPITSNRACSSLRVVLLAGSSRPPSR